MTSVFLDEVCDSLKKSETVLELAASLLRFCSSNKDILASTLKRSEKRDILRAQIVAAEDRIKNLPPFVPLAVRQSFIDELREASDPTLIARALVVAIDEYASEMLRSDALVDASDSSSGIPDVLVHPRNAIKKLYPSGVKLTTSFANTPNSYEVDRTSSLTLTTPPPSGLDVEIDRISGQYLDAAMRNFDVGAPLFGALVPAQTMSDFEFPRLSDGYFGVKPRDEELQNDIIIELLQSAKNYQVSICAAPELACFDSTLDRVLKINSDDIPSIVYLGSVHKFCDSKKVNRAYLIYPEYRRHLYHDKVSFFTERDGQDRIQEAIDLGDSIRFHWGRDWSMVVLTCADFLDPTVRKVLIELRPSFIVVGAMSKKTESFEAHAGEFAAACQSHVLIVNGPRGWGEDVISSRPVTQINMVEADQVVVGRCDEDQHAVGIIGTSSEVVWRS
ncbi:hypothetical protein ACRAJ3_01770 [Rhodococcus pyridinivorans]|uniref:hypothetical protein n=1 Tax=Rhodococcus pyridinivorans TaxID=103816 RepID=UPI0034126508